MDDLVKIDLGDTFSTGQQVKLSAEQLLMAMARRQRDGASLKAIIAEFDLIGRATSPLVLQRALNTGHHMLDQAIERGTTPEETLIWVPKDEAPVRPDDEEDDE